MAAFPADKLDRVMRVNDLAPGALAARLLALRSQREAAA